jgi:hypothetical protein
VSVPVDLAVLPAEVARFGARAIIVSNSPAGPPHVASVLVTVAGTKLTMGAGRKTRANAQHSPAVALVWTSADDNDHCLIVDGTVEEHGSDEFVVVPTSAILHRLAVAPE